MKLYFGTSVRSNALHEKILTFPQFAKLLENPRRLRFDIDEYLDLSEERQKRVKDGVYFCACDFKLPIRSDANALRTQLIPVDIDDQAVDLEQLKKNMAGFNYVFHSTISHNPPKKYRYRLIVESDNSMDAELIPAAMLTVAKMANVTADVETVKISQPVYVPKVVKREPYIFHAELGQSPFTFDDIDLNILSTIRGSKRIKAKDTGDEMLYLAPTLDIDYETAKDALYTIDPDCTRSEWVQVCCAIRHQFQQEPEVGYKLFDEWSSKGAKYIGPDDTRRQYEYEQPNPGDREPITYRSVIKKAKELGWASSRIEKILNTISSINKREPLESLCTKISEDESVTEFNRDILAAAIKDRMNQLGIKVSIKAIRALVKKKLKREAVYTTQDGVLVTNQDFPSWTKNLYYIQETGEFVDNVTGTRMNPGNLNNAYSRYLLSVSDKMAGKARPDVLPSDYLLNVVNIPQVNTVAYMPGYPDLFEFSDGRRALNLYRDTRPERDEDPNHIAHVRETILKHIRNIIPTEYRTLFLDFLTYVVQYPAKRINWAIVLQGTQGCGKTFFAEMISAVLGSNNVGCPDGLTVTKEWTDWTEGKQFLCVEEIRISGQNRVAVMDRLKPFITNTVVTINRRNVNPYQIPNIGKYLLLTNHRDALMIDRNERRYMIIMSKMQTKEAVNTLPPEYFDELFGTLNYPGAIRTYFEDRKISSIFKPQGHAPATQALKSMIEISKPELQTAIEDAIQEEVTPYINAKVVSFKVLKDYLQENNIRGSHRDISRALAGIGLFPVDDKFIDKHNKKHRLYAVPTVRKPKEYMATEIALYDIAKGKTK